MTRGTILTEVPSGMNWVLRSLEICRMTLVAVRVHELIIPTGVARLTGSRSVRPG